MKKTFFYVLLSAFTIGCSNNDDRNELESESSILGKWSFVQSYEFIDDEILSENVSIHQHKCNTNLDYIEFLPSNIGLERYHFDTCTFLDDPFTYSKDTDTLAIDFENLDWEVVIKEVTNEVLILKENNDVGRIYEYKKVN